MINYINNIKTLTLNSFAKRSILNIIFGAKKRSGHNGTIRDAGGKIAERGTFLEEDYFYKKVSNFMVMHRVNKL